MSAHEYTPSELADLLASALDADANAISESRTALRLALEDSSAPATFGELGALLDDPTRFDETQPLRLLMRIGELALSEPDTSLQDYARNFDPKR